MSAVSHRPLRLGMFVMPIHDPAKPLAQCFDKDRELAVRCQQLGFDEFWVGEHHTSTLENIVMPEIFVAKAVGLTTTMRFGPAPVCLQYHAFTPLAQFQHTITQLVQHVKSAPASTPPRRSADAG